MGGSDIYSALYGGYYESQAFLYTHGQMHNLNDMVPSNSGWQLELANAINDRGEIVGNGLH